jgi:RHS repeat-associated protein
VCAGPLSALQTSYGFDSRGNLTSITYPDTTHENWTYNAAFGQPTTYTDADNRLTKFEVDSANGNILSVTHIVGLEDAPANGQTDDVKESYLYTTASDGVPKGMIKQVTDPLNDVTTYEYYNDPNDAETGHEFGWLKQVNYAVGTTDAAHVNYEYDNAGNVSAYVDELGRRTEFVYDDLDELTDVYLPDPDGDPESGQDSPHWHYEYCLCGEMVSQTDPNENTTEYKYDGRRRLKEVILPDPDDDSTVARHSTQYARDKVGNVLTVTDAIRGVNETNEIVYSDARVTAYTYDKTNRATGVTLPNPTTGASSGPTYGMKYDKIGNVVSVTDPMGNVTSYRYDAASQLVEEKESDPANGAITANSPTTTYTYYDSGLPKTVTDPMGRTTTNSYDDLGRLKEVLSPDPDGGDSQLAPRVDYTYDKASNLKTATDRLGHQTSWDYDHRDRVVTMTNPDNKATGYTYYDNGTLETLTDPDTNVTTWFYDDLDRVKQEKNELEDSRFFEYDDNGNLIQKRDREDRITQYDYDHLNQLTAERWLAGDENSATIHTINYGYDFLGQMTHAADPTASYDFTIDKLGRAGTIAADVAGLPSVVTLTQGFNDDGLRTSLSADIGATHDFRNDYTPDHLNRITKITQQGQGGNTVADKRVEFGYNADGQFTSIDRYSALTGTSSLAASSSFDYDLTGRLKTLTHFNGGTTLAGYGFGYDAANRLTSFTNTAHTDENVTTFSYDNASQLTDVDRPNTANDESYAYDDNGNRTSANGTTYGTPATNNRLSTDGTYQYYYDGEGNITKRVTLVSGSPTGATTEYSYDYRNRLVNVTLRTSPTGTVTKTVDYSYDPFDRMVAKTVDPDGPGGAPATSEYSIYDGERAVLKLNANGTAKERLVWADQVDMLMADETAANGLFFPLEDYQGTVRDVVNASGTLVNHITYDSFGNIKTQTSGAPTTTLIYAGLVWDADANQYRSFTRMYDAATGRWTSEDKIEFAGDPSNINRYVENGATNATDPEGLKIRWHQSRGKDENGKWGTYWYWEEYDTYFFFWRGNSEFGPSQFVPDVVQGIPDLGGAGSNGACANFQDVANGAQTSGEIVQAGIQVGLVVIPGPEDVIIAGAARLGYTVLKAGGKWAIKVGAKLLKGEEEIQAARKIAAATKIAKSESPIWKALKNFRDGIKTNGLNGAKRQYYGWDNLHGEVEVYDSCGKHIGVIDPWEGKPIKSAVPGRTIDIK